MWSLTIGTNVFRIDVGGLSELPVSIPTNVYLKTQMFISEDKLNSRSDRYFARAMTTSARLRLFAVIAGALLSLGIL